MRVRRIHPDLMKLVSLGYLLLLAAPALALRSCVLAPQRIAAVSRAAAFMQAEETDEITLKLTDCLANGIGIGLDTKNCIDMIKPGGAGSKKFVMGDEVVLWNGQELYEVAGGRKVQRKLVDVVEQQDVHTVVVKRVRKAWSANYEPTSYETSSWDSNTGSGSWG